MRRNLARVFSSPSLPSAIKQLLRAEDADLPSVISFQKIKKKKENSFVLREPNAVVGLRIHTVVAQWKKFQMIASRCAGN